MPVVGLECLYAIAGFGDNAEIGFLVDDVGDTRPEQGVIVHEQNAGLFDRGACPAVAERRRIS
jgi:hypothetical protein